MTDAERDHLLQKMEARMDSIYTALYVDENGRRGLMTRMALMENRWSSLVKIVTITVGILLTANVGVLVAILTHTLKLP
jgi:hypothetical protein